MKPSRLTPTSRATEQLARIAEEEDWGGEVHLYQDQAEMDQALGIGRQEYGLVSI